ncbi:hypothetical protein DsansV1_C19g0158111 [Dioscorea sansibarensis]
MHNNTVSWAARQSDFGSSKPIQILRIIIPGSASFLFKQASLLASSSQVSLPLSSHSSLSRFSLKPSSPMSSSQGLDRCSMAISNVVLISISIYSNLFEYVQG